MRAKYPCTFVKPFQLLILNKDAQEFAEREVYLFPLSCALQDGKQSRSEILKSR